jgi:hypothetical protein
MRRFACAVSVAAVVLAGCSRTASLTSGPPLPLTRGSATSVDSITGAGDPWLYVATGVSNEVNAYDLALPGLPLVETITQGISSPVGLTVGGDGTLYVSNGAPHGSVTEYAPGQTTPKRTLAVGIAASVALDERGRVFVSTRAPASIIVFEPGSSQRFRTITNKLLAIPSQIVFGKGGKLYISDNQTGVYVLQDGTYQMHSLNLQFLPGCPTGIALDEARDEIFVSGCVGGTQVYLLGNPNPARTLDEPFPADNVASGAYQGRSVVFAPDLNSNTVVLYHTVGTEPFLTIATASQQPVGIAYKPATVPP